MRKVLIVYASKTGVTQEAAQMTAAKLGMTAALYDCRRRTLTDAEGNMSKQTPSISNFSAVVLGTAMYMGAPLKACKRFCSDHEKELLSLPVALFTCGVETPETDEQYLRSHLSSSLMQHILIYRHLGGEVRPERMNAFERMAMKEFEKKHGKAPGIDDGAIRKLCEAINTYFNKGVSI